LLLRPGTAARRCSVGQGGAISRKRTQINGRQKAQETQNIPPAKHPKEEHFKKLKN
jgi:hypothetical protein